MDQEPKLLKRCEHCGTAFTVKRLWQRFCKPRCRFDFHNNENRQLIALAKAALKAQPLREQAKTPETPST